MGIVKEVKRTVNVAWSPKQMQSILLAGGTVAQQLDATFSTSAHIEIFSLDLTSPGRDLQCVGKIHSKSRFHKLNWSGLGLEDGSHPQGVIIGGSDNGSITFWDAAKILQSDSEDALICQTDHHIGAVRTLDVNPFQGNLLASGASESEIYIWDLNNPSTPMSPGNKLHPLEDITCVAWNRQAQHILGSTSPSGRSVVWDLRKNEPIIQVSDSNARVHCKALCWHPNIPTQLVTGSEDDRSPVIQLWDLRFATSPTRILERHKRGVLSLSWCQQDADLLLSAGKDNQVLCWNPNSNVQEGEVVYQLPATSQWIFDCLWCPRNPDIICTSSFDGHVSLYSLLGGGSAGGNRGDSGPPTPNKIDSNDPFTSIANAQKKVTQIEEKPLKTPPKWFRRPCAASFGFGGRLVSFGSKGRVVAIHQVVTEPHLLRQSNDFEAAIQNKQFIEHCEGKVDSAKSQREQKIWNFLKATFDSDPRRQYLQLLGYDTDELNKQLSIIPESAMAMKNDLSVDKLQEKLATLPLEEQPDEEEKEEEDKQGTDDGNTDNTTAKLFGSEGGTEGSRSPFDEIGIDSTLDFASSAAVVPSHSGGSTGIASSLSLNTGDDPDGLLTKALLIGNFQAAVNICINTDRMAEALILSVAGGSELYETTRQRFLKQSDCQITKLISLVTNKNWSDIVKNGSLNNWEEVLASLVTYATPDEFTTLCNDLGKRLEDAGRYDDAVLCYICSGNIEKFVNCWLILFEDQSLDPLSLHDLIEKVVLLRQAINKKTRIDPVPFNSPQLGDKIRVYADLLAAQGSLNTALAYLELTATPTQGEGGSILRDRLYRSIGLSGNNPPPFPFDRVNIGSHSVTPPTQTTNITPLNQYSTEPNMPIYNRAGYNDGGSIRHGGVSDTNTTTTTANTYYPTPEQLGRNVPLNPMVQGGGGGAMQTVPMVTSVMQPGPHGPSNIPPKVSHVMHRPNYPPVPNTVTAPSMFPVTSSYQPPPMDTPTAPPTTGATAWNDPPMLAKHKKKTTSYTPPAPITTPLAAPAPMDPIQPLVPVGQGTGGGIPPSNINTTGKPPTPVDTKVPGSPVTPIEKKPIPSEHSLIPTVLEGLLSRCRPRANNIAMKRKLDEISRKLEILSDLLRESRLSTDVLQGLHFIAQDCQAMNYQSALARLNQMVASSNLSEISSFFPGIKTLFQLAIQLRV